MCAHLCVYIGTDTLFESEKYSCLLKDNLTNVFILQKYITANQVGKVTCLVGLYLFSFEAKVGSEETQ